MDLQQLSRLELRQICYFMTLVQAENNFTVAADRLGINQPPLTQRIQALEKFLSSGQAPFPVKLFDRSTRPITLTTAGEVFLEEIEQALVHLDRAVFRSQQASKGQIGRLTIGVTNFIANSILPDIIQQFQQRFPNVALEMQEIILENRFNLIKQRKLDIIFEQAEQFDHLDQELTFQPILKEHFILAVAQQHPLAIQSRVCLQDLQTEQVILPSLKVFPFYQQVVSLCQDVGFEPNLVEDVSATGVVTLLSLVAAGVGIAILPNHVRSLQREGVVYRSIENVHLTRQVAAVWKQDNHSIVLRQFLQVIQEVMNFQLKDSW